MITKKAWDYARIFVNGDIVPENKMLLAAMNIQQIIEDAAPDLLAEAPFDEPFDKLRTALRTQLRQAQDENKRLREACQAIIETCKRLEMCEDGIIESYPPYGAESFNGAGDPIINYAPCPYCTAARAALARGER